MDRNQDPAVPVQGNKKHDKVDMSSKSEIVKKCKALPYTFSKRTDNRIYEAAASALDDMYRQYGYAAVLGVLSDLWQFEDAVSFFKKDISEARSGHKIRTVAVSCHRGFDGGVARVNAALMNVWTDMGYNVVFFSSEGDHEMDFLYI